MLMIYQDGLYYPDFSIHVLLTLEGWMVMFNMIYPPWPSRTDNNLNIFMAELSDSNRKLWSLDTFSTLTDFSFNKWSHFLRVINSELSLLPRWHISSPSLTTTENLLYIKEEIFMVYTVIWRWLKLQQHWPLQVIALIISAFYFP